MFLTKPEIMYKESFIEALEEFHLEGRNLSFEVDDLNRDFMGFVQQLIDKSDSTKITKERVPVTYFWLIDNNEFIGRVSIRHYLVAHLYRDGHVGYEIRPSKRGLGYGKQILKLGVEKARDIGLTKVLLTCDSDNFGSKKIIEYCDGNLENEIVNSETGISKLRYWIELMGYST